ncbi:arylsulfatase J-like [Sycon ciliatum]|uniref:arylsulfatase J-like n=1 Tax=Sycon ciliatum TaxID=27933 RepID=UPI0031F64E99
MLVDVILVKTSVVVAALILAACYHYRQPSAASPKGWAGAGGGDAETIRHKHKQPHILFIVADDLGWNDVGFHNKDMRTPNLDALAHSGIILNQSYVQPSCSPSRSCLMTGRYTHHTGFQNVLHHCQPYGLNSSMLTIAQRLKQLGYSTHAVGKWHLGYCNEKFLPTSRGFDSFYGYYGGSQDYYTHFNGNGAKAEGFSGYDFHHDIGDKRSIDRAAEGVYSTEAFAKETISIVKKHNTSTPLYIYLAFQAIHAPLQAPQRYWKMFKDVAWYNRRAVSAMATAMDDAVGNIVKALKKRGIWDDTLVVFTSDNGAQVRYGGSNYPLRGNKGTVWEGGTRSPGFVHGKMLGKTKRTHNGIMHVTDWYPTLVSAAGGHLGDSEVDGIDQWSALQNNLPSPRTGFPYRLDRTRRVFAIREGKYKFIRGKHPPKHQAKHTQMNLWYPAAVDEATFATFYRELHFYENITHKVETGPWLFDLDADPLEMSNLYAELPGVAAALNRRVDEYMTDYVDPMSIHYSRVDPKCNPALRNGTWDAGWC